MPRISKIHSLKGLKSYGRGIAKCPFCGKIGYRAYTRKKDGKKVLRCQYCHNAESTYWK